MLKFAKKRVHVDAVQWTGEMTPEVVAVVGDRKHGCVLDEKRRIALGNEWYADIGDWILRPVKRGTALAGEDLGVMSAAAFANAYEQVDECGQPTCDEHEADARAFVGAVNAILTEGLRLSPEHNPNVFRASNELERKLRRLLEDHAWIAARDERQRVKDRIVKDIL